MRDCCLQNIEQECARCGIQPVKDTHVLKCVLRGDWFVEGEEQPAAAPAAVAPAAVRAAAEQPAAAASSARRGGGAGGEGGESRPSLARPSAASTPPIQALTPLSTPQGTPCATDRGGAGDRKRKSPAGTASGGGGGGAPAGGSGGASGGGRLKLRRADSNADTQRSPREPAPAADRALGSPRAAAGESSSSGGAQRRSTDGAELRGEQGGQGTLMAMGSGDSDVCADEGSADEEAEEQQQAALTVSATVFSQKPRRCRPDTRGETLPYESSAGSHALLLLRSCALSHVRTFALLLRFSLRRSVHVVHLVSCISAEPSCAPLCIGSHVGSHRSFGRHALSSPV